MPEDSVKTCLRCNKSDITSFSKCRFCGTKYSTGGQTRSVTEVPKIDPVRVVSLIILVAFAALLVYGINSIYRASCFTAAEREDMPLDLPALLSPPVQVMLSNPEVFTFKGCTITKLASYVVTGRILCRFDCFVLDGMYDLAPVDLGLGWNFMADKRMISQMNIYSGGRTMGIYPPQSLFRYYPNKQLIDWKQIYPNFSHNHIIPANDHIKQIVQSLHRGQVVTLRGFLVTVNRPGFAPWRSSLSRDDTGEGACEIMYVDDVKIY